MTTTTFSGEDGRVRRPINSFIKIVVPGTPISINGAASTRDNLVSTSFQSIL